jgi:hypothetical protein
MPAYTPDEIHTLFAAGLNSGDVDAVAGGDVARSSQHVARNDRERERAAGYAADERAATDRGRVVIHEQESE